MTSLLFVVLLVSVAPAPSLGLVPQRISHALPRPLTSVLRGRCPAVPRPSSPLDDPSPMDMAKKRGNRKGFYIRPSAAVEQGGGFFVPGLEGWRLQFAISVVVLGLLVANRFPGYDVARAQLVSESIAAVVGLVLMLDALSQAVGLPSAAADPDSTQATTLQRVTLCAEDLPPDASRENVLWAANALLDLTASQMAVLRGPDGIVACVGNFEPNHPVVQDGPAAFAELRTAGEPAAAEGETVRVVERRRAQSGQDKALFALAPSRCGAVALQPPSDYTWAIAAPSSDAWTTTQLDWLVLMGTWVAPSS